MKKIRLNEYFQLARNKTPLQTKSGKGFKLIYVDPELSTDSTFDNKELLKKYHMEYLPYNRYIRNIPDIPKAWGWIVWDGTEAEIHPYIKKFADEIGQQETPPDGGVPRTAEQVLAAIDDVRDIIMQAEEASDEIDGGEIIARAEEFKEMLAKGIGSKETMDALAELVRFRIEMSKHMGHQLSMVNTIMAFFQKPNARDVRSKGEWREMGYTPKEGAVPIVLSMPSRFKKYYGSKYNEIVKRFLEKYNVTLISDLTPSQKRRLDRATKYPDVNCGFKPYLAYDISDMIAGEGAETFPENKFKWYDADSDETEKERLLIDACIAFGKSIGVKDYEFVSGDRLGGSRGTASSNGYVKIIDDKKNHGSVSTVIHETAHQIMHWEVVMTTNPKLKRFYQGGSMLRGKEIVEQEAELCAWVVLTAFGYENQQEHFNYLANWGMNVSNCNKVFDQVMNVANFVYNGMEKQLMKNAESKKVLQDTNPIPEDGEELADMVGYGDLYDAAEEKDKTYENKRRTTEIVENFKKMKNKMDSIFKRNIQDIID